MNLFEAKNHVKRCKESFEKVKSLFSSEERRVLDGVSIVVCSQGNQLELSRLNAECLGGKYSDMLSPSSSKNWLVRLVKRKVWIQKKIDELKKDLVYVNRQLTNVSETRLELNSFTVELRFGQLDYDLIENLKHSEITDKYKTMMSRASIRIIIKPLKEV